MQMFTLNLIEVLKASIDRLKVHSTKQFIFQVSPFSNTSSFFQTLDIPYDTVNHLFIYNIIFAWGHSLVSVFVCSVYIYISHDVVCVILVANMLVAINLVATMSMTPGCEHVGCEHLGCEHAGCEHVNGPWL